MEQPEQESENPTTSEIAEFAEESYRCEPGTKKAIDTGVMTMRELEIYHYLNAWTNQNAPWESGENDENEKAYMQTLEEAYKVAAKLYSISEEEARRIFEKIRNIPRT